MLLALGLGVSCGLVVGAKSTSIALSYVHNPSTPGQLVAYARFFRVFMVLNFVLAVAVGFMAAALVQIDQSEFWFQVLGFGTACSSITCVIRAQISVQTLLRRNRDLTTLRKRVVAHCKEQTKYSTLEAEERQAETGFEDLCPTLLTLGLTSLDLDSLYFAARELFFIHSDV